MNIIQGRDSTGVARDLGIDLTTHMLGMMDYPHKEIHGGSSFYVMYSVVSLGAMTTPDDMISLDFTTPNTTKWGHFQFAAKGTAGWRVKLTEAPSGGAASPTGQLTIINKNRNSSNQSVFTDGSTANQVNYDSTEATGGTDLWDEYLHGDSGILIAGSAVSGGRDEIILKQNTKYQLNLFGTDANPATLYMSWYENTNKE